jgi:nucleotide-binding universal stress UspA family protein
MQSQYPPGHPKPSKPVIDLLVVQAVGPVVLIAIHGAVSLSARVVRRAHHLFGERATYFAIDVEPGPNTEMSWEYVLPVGSLNSPVWVDSALEAEVEASTANAKSEARAVSHDGGLDQVTPIGEIGDPVTAIVRMAHRVHADVVVVGASDRNWLGRLHAGSVERGLLRAADFALLVVEADPPGDSLQTPGES